MEQNQGMYKTSKVAVWISYAYLLLPFLIFSVGWFGKRYWIPMLPLLLLCYRKACKDTTAFWRPEFTSDNIIKMIFIVLIISVWVYYSGIGRLVFQNLDHNCRNAVYETLVYWDWPILNYDIILETWSPGTTVTSLVYYIGFWLPAAIVGKIFGIDAGYGFQIFWAILGIMLVYYFICARKRKLIIWPLAILIFFSGLDIVGQYFRGIDLFTLSNSQHLEWWVEPYQYSSMTTQLFWVFNQAVPAWLCTIFAYMQKNNRSLIFILACCMLPGTFPFVGLLVLVIYWVLTRDYHFKVEGFSREKGKKYIRTLIKDTVTIQNVLGGGIIGIFTFLYLNANLSSSLFMQKSVFGASYDNHLSKYLIFVLLEVGVYFMVLYKYHKKNGLYYILLISLVVIPPFKVGAAGDFCMRASIPALFLLMLLVIDTLEESRQRKDAAVLIWLVVILSIGGITPLHEITRTFQNTIERLNTESQLYETAIDGHELLNSPNFSGSIDDSFFFKYIAR